MLNVEEYYSVNVLDILAFEQTTRLFSKNKKCLMHRMYVSLYRSNVNYYTIYTIIEKYINSKN